MFTLFAEQEVRRVAQAAGLDPDAALAVAETLSGGQALVHFQGRTEPSISFRPHVFHRRLRPEARAAAVRAGLAGPRAGEGPAPVSQRERHALFARARLIDREAAYAACAWGLARAPGEMAHRLGFESAEALAEEARSGVAGQTALLARMIDALGLRAASMGRDWDALAIALAPERPQAAARAMAEAHARRGADEPRRPDAEAATAPLGVGARGVEVARLQRALRARDGTAPVGGVFDAPTRAAMGRFQSVQGPPRDGGASDAFWPRLRSALRRAAPV
jgi:hypothetical protein